MFFYFSRFLIRLALPIFLRRLMVVNLENVPKRGPLLLASNHPDSFFDALVIGATLTQMIHTLARGDAFKKPAVAFWLRQIKLIPVFRGSEGRDQVRNLDNTTKESLAAMREGDAVIVFSEGVCVNEWKLRPLGKGTARMAHQAWFGDASLTDMLVIPTGMNYEHYRGTGKRVSIRFGEAIKRNDLKTNPEEYEKWLREFNDLLQERMNREILTIPEGASKEERLQAMNAFFGTNSVPSNGNVFFRAIGWVGRAIHRPLYHVFTKKVAKITARSVFYDSALFGLLLYLYPTIVLILSLIVGLFAGFKAGLALFATLPLLAWMGNRYR
ncbi:glycerol acyltransferase [Dyadobacter psychrotolerans]|uniref:Glycerol acyltransferase n=1 Tax=Dyadobacter psychrotolerans TaxID=2541721 RepID=A0A4R5DKL7_9BACT|nr:glycerol acyltransferase [Dyadobacter psychrotolerans]